MELPSALRLAEVLDSWEGQAVAVRVVTETNDLVAVFAGILGARTNEEHPAWFWPVESSNPTPETRERRGIYVLPELLSQVELHVGGFVVEYAQAGVTVNLRRLEPVAAVERS